jgi:TolA-binding protein
MKHRVALAPICLLAGLSVQAQKRETEIFRNAHQLYDSGRLADAEKGFAEIVRDHPDNIAAQMFLGQTLFKEEKYAAAVAPYERVRAVEKDGVKLSPT